jgi:hypothetical protein
MFIFPVNLTVHSFGGGTQKEATWEDLGLEATILKWILKKYTGLTSTAIHLV